ncbi:hypothetical protein GCM10010429_55120 [Micromonospora olivasterospora]
MPACGRRADSARAAEQAGGHPPQVRDLAQLTVVEAQPLLLFFDHRDPAKVSQLSIMHPALMP